VLCTVSIIKINLISRAENRCLLVTRQLPSKGLSTVSTPTETVETEEYAVYSNLIESWYVNKDIRLIVIEDHSELGEWGWRGALDDALQFLMEASPGVAEEVISSFKRRNQNPGLLKPLFSLSVPYVLIGSHEMEDIFQPDRDGWEEFYRRYPNSPGTIWLSRVGLDVLLKLALVYIGRQSHWRAGAGHFVLLKKENGAWSVQRETVIWIS
jgi:hypothetical protein